MPPKRPPLRILGVYAHPDDETLCAGGTLAKYASSGADILIVSATQGERGKIRDAHLATRSTLGHTRVIELHLACERLGVAQAICLDYGDGQLMSVDRYRLIAQLTKIIRIFRPDVVLTFGDDGAYGHPDHIAIGAATDEAVIRAGEPTQFAEQLAHGVMPHKPVQLYHSYFPQNPNLLLELFSSWLVSRDTYFQSSPHFASQLTDFAHDLVMMGYSSDHITVSGYPPRTSIIKQGDTPDSLYLILSGTAEVMREREDGSLERLAEIGPGSFFGEEGIASNRPRNAHVFARTSLSCLVFSRSQPTTKRRRAWERDYSIGAIGTQPKMPSAITQIEVSDYVPQKVAAMAAHRTQFSVMPEIFPQAFWQSLFTCEYFVRIYPISRGAYGSSREARFRV